MKKLRIVAAAAALSIVLSGCSSQKGNEPSADNSQTAQITEPLIAETTAPADGEPEDTGTDTESAAAPEQGEQENKLTYEWEREPFLEADDINMLSAGAGILNNGDYLHSDYLLITRGGKIGLINGAGEIIVEPECTRAFSNAENGDQHIIFTDGSPEEGDRICFCVSAGGLFRTAEDVCTLCGGSLHDSEIGLEAVYDPELDLSGTLPAPLLLQKKEGEGVLLGTVLELEPDLLLNGAVVRSISLPRDYSEDDDLATGTLNANYGIVRNRIAMTAMIYEDATDFKNGVAALCRNGKWGYLNTAGRQFLPFDYDADFACFYDRNGKSGVTYYPYLPSEGSIALNRDGRAGYVALNGEVIAPIGTFAKARPVIGGIAWVKDKQTGLWGTIRMYGGTQIPETETAELPAVEVEPPEQGGQTQNPNPDGWQQAYADILRSDGTGESLQFSLCNVDGDGVPELVLHWYDRKGFEQSNEDVEMYTYYDGKVLSLGNVACDGYCTCKYLPQKSMVLIGGLRDDVAVYDFRRLENGSLVTVCSFNMVIGGDKVTYMVDDKECDKATYIAKWKSYYNGDISYDGGMYHNNEANIAAALGLDAPAAPAAEQPAAAG